MKIIVISDNHGRTKSLEDIKTMYQDADIFIHCGDSELPPDYLNGYIAVCGNNDYYDLYPEYRVVDALNHKILVIHGHRLLLFGTRDMLVDKAKSLGCDIVCFGHTHIYEDKTIDGIRIINPGSISLNRDGSMPSYAILEIEGDSIKVTRKEYHFLANR